MRTKNHLDIDQMIAEVEDNLYSCDAPEIERYWSKVVLDKLIGERAEAIAELRASPDWDELPF
ncbi:hypothetical protein [Shinella zoogloeoides]|uniref:hypothetical protein n=1 Tax=Shinella zoogloeoides TaxID=352475 RepID=UPI000E65C6F8|nr:hypothetical protein [Shinella zoogloeoides]